MPQVVETIPDPMAAEAEAARAWFARERNSEFKLTGIVDPDESLESDGATGARDLQLILCGTQDGQDVCLRERFTVKPGEAGGDFDVTHIPDAGPAVGSPAPLLDPPAGVRSGWLDGVLRKHAFVVLVFYRGFW
jgi:hypothetical protein